MPDDQAQHLRRLAREAPSLRLGHPGSCASPASAGCRRARTVAVTGGKGGVGKTNLSVALALCAARSGLRVALLDADFGLAKIHVLLGLSPKADLRDVLSGAARLEDTLIDGPEGVRVLPGASGLAELANLDGGQRELLLSGLEEVSEHFDLLLVDTGAGISENVLSFVIAADEAVVVTTPEPTALADAYGLIKVSYDRRKDLPFHLLINNAASPAEADAAARRLTEVTQRFLKMPISYSGRVPADPLVRAAVRARKPFLSHAPDGPAALAFRPVAAKILGIDDISLPTAPPVSSVQTMPNVYNVHRDAASGQPQVMPPAPQQTFVQRLSSLFGMGRRG
jgi:flagellar biosynthesis protein FlhG